MKNLAIAVAALGAAACVISDSDNQAGSSDDETPDAAPAAESDARPVTPGADAAPPVTSCEGLAALPEDDVVELEHDGVTRRFQMHVPPSYDPTVPVPLVMNFHGYTSNAGQQRALSGMASKADDEGFIAVHPDGVDNSWNAGGCCGTAQSTGVDDVGFAGAIMDYVESVACVDRRRIYVTGLSNGGFMSHRLACDLSDRVAAIAPVAGGNQTASCDPTRPVPVMHFHGTADTVVPFSDGEQSMGAWAERNGCSGESDVTFEMGNATCETFSGCDGGAEAILCTIAGFGHWWPGAVGAVSGIDATDAMWEFFERHSLP